MSKWKQTYNRPWGWEWGRVETNQWNWRETADRWNLFVEVNLNYLQRPIFHLSWYDEDEIGFGVSWAEKTADPFIGFDFTVRLREPWLTRAIWVTGLWRGLRNRD